MTTFYPLFLLIMHEISIFLLNLYDCGKTKTAINSMQAKTLVQRIKRKLLTLN